MQIEVWNNMSGWGLIHGYGCSRWDNILCGTLLNSKSSFILKANIDLLLGQGAECEIAVTGPNCLVK